ncbi:MAG: nuclear transport factor 2 family protein [Gordonia paraffinivorans]
MLSHDTRAAITDLVVEFAYRIDHDAGHGVDELFTADGRYVLFGHPVEGREGIRAMYDHRRSRGTRTSRHIFDNVRITPDDDRDDVVHVTSVLTLHAADGEPPLPLAPLLVADYTDTVVRDDDGRWRFSIRDTALLFQPSEQG